MRKGGVIEVKQEKGMRVKGGMNEDEKERGIRKVVSYKERKHTVLNSSSFPKIYYGV